MDTADPAPTDLPAPAPRRRRVALAPGAVAVVAVLATGGALLASSAGRTAPALPAPLGTASAVPTPLPVPREVDLSDEEPAYAPVDEQTMTWLTDLQLALADDPGFGTVAISADRATVTITWFGDRSPALEEQVAAAPDGVAVVVRPADFAPAELQDLVREAMTPDLLPGVRVTMGGAENDGSGLRLGIEELPPGRTLEEVAAQLADALGRPDVPITLEVAQVTAASA